MPRSHHSHHMTHNLVHVMQIEGFVELPNGGVVVLFELVAAVPR